MFAHNDATALVLLRLARESGVAIPGQLSLVGFDDISDVAVSNPPLTTVTQPYLEIGAAAVRLLIERIESGEGGETAPPYLAVPQLVVRASTSVPCVDFVSPKGNSN